MATTRKRRTRAFRLVLSDEEHRQLFALAEEEGLSAAQLLRRYVRQQARLRIKAASP